MFLILFMTAMMNNPLANASPKTVLVPLPSYGFDPTESGVPWTYLVKAGHKIVFATPDGKPAAADVRMLTGQDLGIWKKVLMNDANGAKAYREMAASKEFLNPISYAMIESKNFDAILLPGGHDKGMRPYLESQVLQNAVVEFFETGKPVAAICHGTLLAARSISSRTGNSVLWGRKTTGLTKNQEMLAYNLTRWYLGDYYRTYATPMETELRGFLRAPTDYDAGPGFLVPSARDTAENLSAGFTVRDRNYVSARWPGDAHKFGSEFAAMLNEK